MSTKTNTEVTDSSKNNHAAPSDSYDLVIIGAGPGGYSTALRSAQLGARVALIEEDSTVGGTCLNRGCIPTKALMSATSTITLSAHARQLGIQSTFDGIDFNKLTTFKQSSVDAMTTGLSQLFSQHQVTVIHGRASILSPRTVEVTNNGKQPFVLQANDIVLATGAHSTPLPEQPFTSDILDSDRALDLKKFPEHPVIIGAGAVAVEFASIWQAAGSQVRLLIRKDRVLSDWDRRTSMALTRALQKQGIEIITGSQCTRIEHEHEGLCVSYGSSQTDSNGLEQQVTADKVLVAIGRTPNTDDPWFAHAGIDTDPHGLVLTDSFGRTSCKHVWAVGDITPGYHFAHRAFEQGIVVAESIAGLNPLPVDENSIPQVVFSTPQAACIGLGKESAEARDDLLEIQETIYPMLSNARMRMSGSTGSLSLVTACKTEDPTTRIVVGVHIVAPEAAELIAEAEQIVGNQVPVSKAARLIHPHPTFSEALGEALLKADGRPLHMR